MSMSLNTINYHFKTYWPLIIIVVSGCSHTEKKEVVFNTSGLKITHEKRIYHYRDINLAVDITERVLNEHLKKDLDLRALFLKHSVSVHFHQHRFYGECVELVLGKYMCEKKYNGLNVGGYRIFVWDYFNCIADGAFVHELIHTVIVKHLGYSGHPQPLFCASYPECKKDESSLLKIINDELRDLAVSCE